MDFEILFEGIKIRCQLGCSIRISILFYQIKHANNITINTGRSSCVMYLTLFTGLPLDL